MSEPCFTSDASFIGLSCAIGRHDTVGQPGGAAMERSGDGLSRDGEPPTRDAG